MRVLLVEDDREAAQLSGQGVDRSRSRPHIAYNGEEGLEFARLKEHDVLIIDRMLPGLMGSA